MKKLLSIIAVVALAATVGVSVIPTVGCSSTPTPSAMRTISFAFGVSAGLVCNETKIDNDTRNAICGTMGVIRGCIPETNETFEVCWMRAAEIHVKELIEKGTIDDKQGDLVLAAFRVVTKGIDYLFYRYPEARTYKDLVVASIDGFCDGYLTVFKPVNMATLCSKNRVDQVTYDVGAYRYLKAIKR